MSKAKSLAIITARGGSKRIPKKNIRPFLGKPIIAYSIEAALASGLFDEVMVSTDSEEIAEVARNYGASVPFMRSAKNADDYSTTADVLLEVTAQYVEMGKDFDYACCLYPTAPFVTSHKLIDAFALIQKGNVDTVFPVVAFSFPIQRALAVKEGQVEIVQPGDYQKRSQDLEPRYHDTGQFYWFKPSTLLATGQLVGERTGAIICSELEVQDIDVEVDWKLAELKYQLWKTA